MALHSRNMHWTLFAALSEAPGLLTQAIASTDFNLVSAKDAVVVEVPRSLRRNRWASRITGQLSASEVGTEIDWVVDGLGNKQADHLFEISEGIPEGLLFDHGLPEALQNVSMRFFGRKEIKYLQFMLDRRETVHAVTVGQFSEKWAIAALTSSRLLFLQKSVGQEELTSFDLNDIGALSLDKKMAGETLTIRHQGTIATISHMGPGQGEKLARKFREVRDQPSGGSVPRPVSASVPTTDPLAQIERLVVLRDNGTLTREEFETAKARLLGQL
jgi:hypothetical protein